MRPFLPLYVLMSFFLTSLSGLPAHGMGYSDDLVEGLDCSRPVTAAAVYRAIRPVNIAFNPGRRIDTKNDFHKQGYSLGLIQHCWALSRWQRLALLLGRAYSPPSVPLRYDATYIGNLVRGYYNPVPGVQVLAETEYKVFRWPVDGQFAYDGLHQFISDYTAAGGDYYEQLAKRQQYEFYAPFSNAQLIGPSQNYADHRKELEKIAYLAERKELPLAVIKSSTFSQHVVIVTEVKRYPDRWNFNVIDPDNPLDRANITVREVAPRTYQAYYYDNEPVDIFLVSEYERPQIDAALVKHYSMVCPIIQAQATR